MPLFAIIRFHIALCPQLYTLNRTKCSCRLRRLGIRTWVHLVMNVSELDLPCVNVCAHYCARGLMPNVDFKKNLAYAQQCGSVCFRERRPYRKIDAMRCLYRQSPNPWYWWNRWLSGDVESQPRNGCLDDFDMKVIELSRWYFETTIDDFRYNTSAL